MNGKIRLDTRKTELRKNGFPVCVFLHHKGKQKKINLGLYFFLKDWNLDKQLPKNNNTALFYIKKKKLQLEELVFNYRNKTNLDFERVKKILLDIDNSINEEASYLSFYEIYLNELLQKNKKGSYFGYKTAVDQLKKYRSEISFVELDYNLLNGFKNWRIKEGNSKSTIHTYLRKLRAVYNEAVRRKITTDQKPFSGIFNNITVKANRTKKRHLKKSDIRLLENLQLTTMHHQRAIDLFLLMFYFGGQDLKDIYYLKHSQINKNRVYFMRGKLDGNGYQFDLPIVPKAQKIIDKYKVKGEYLFGWRKDFAGYKNFRDNLRRSFDYVQTAENIEVQPLGGKIRIKVARHSFATIAKGLFIDTDLLRELMGHERNDVDTIYKDKYPEKIRDEALLKIIG